MVEYTGGGGEGGASVKGGAKDTLKIKRLFGKDFHSGGGGAGAGALESMCGSTVAVATWRGQRPRGYGSCRAFVFYVIVVAGVSYAEKINPLRMKKRINGTWDFL